MTWWKLARLAGIGCVLAGVAVASCGPSDDDDDDDDDVQSVTPPPAHCLADAPCQVDADCSILGGYRCNTLMVPPECEELYCGPAYSMCSTDELCQIGLRCHESACSPCDICGDRCEVDFDTDPDHCGGCQNPVPAGGFCDGGVPACPMGLTPCGDVCVNLADNPAHCGACHTPVPPGAVCRDGTPSCQVDCSNIDMPQCHESFCSEQSWDCAIRYLDNGTPCDDGNDCTSDDACWAGDCVGVTTC